MGAEVGRLASNPLRRTETHLEAPSGRSLFYRTWLPREPLGSPMLFVHGLGEHSGRYEPTASWFADRGRAVHAYDQGGHGLSSGRRGHVHLFDDFLDDLEFVLDRLAAESGKIRPILIGHSMGGLVVATLACERDPAIELLVTSGPALALGPDISRGRIRAARWLGRVLPGFSMQAGLDVEALSRDPDVIRLYQDDPLVHGRMSAALAVGMLDRVTRTAGSAQCIKVPMLLLHGEEDSLCPVTGSRLFYSGLSREVAGDSQLRTYAGLRHEIFNEPEREQIYADLLAWVEGMEDRR